MYCNPEVLVHEKNFWYYRGTQRRRQASLKVRETIAARIGR